MRLAVPGVVICLLGTWADQCQAQSVVVPNASTTVGGSQGVYFDYPQAGMVGIAASELAGIPFAATITGVSFRPYAAPTGIWPATLTKYANFDITIGYAQPLASWTSLFATNFKSTPAPVRVRTGPLYIEPKTYRAGPVVSPQTQPWGDFFFDFQHGFTYVGGDLAIYFTHDTQPTSATIGLDYAFPIPASTVQSMGSGYQGTTGAFVPYFRIMRIHYGYGVGCPGVAGWIPTLVLTNDTAGGGTMSLAIVSGRASMAAAYMLGASKPYVALPNGCTLMTQPQVVLPVTLSNLGRDMQSFTLPPSVLGTVHVQGAVLDASAPGGFTVTNGVTFTAR